MNTRSWMTDTLQQSWSFGQRRLRDIIVPGAHDSGTYDPSGKVDLPPPQSTGVPILDGFVHTMADIVAGIGARTMEPWVQTQNIDFYAQLCAGVRYLDLRIARYQNRFHLYHGSSIVNTTLGQLLEQVARFKRENPYEIVILNVTHVLNFGSADHAPCLDAIFKALTDEGASGSWLLRNTEMSRTIREIMTAPPVLANGLPATLIFATSANTLLPQHVSDAQRPYIFQDLDSAYDGSLYETLSKIPGFVESQFQRRFGWLWVAQFIGTPGGANMGSSPFVLAKQLNPKIAGWLRNWKHNINVFIMDFVGDSFGSAYSPEEIVATTAALNASPEGSSWLIGRSFFLTNAHDAQLQASPEGVVVCYPNRMAWEVWSAEDAGNGRVFLRNAHGKLLTADGNGVVGVSTNRLDYEKWRIDAAPDGNLRLVSHHNTLLGARPEGAVYMTTNTMQWEEWHVEIVDAPFKRECVITSSHHKLHIGTRPDGSLYLGTNKGTWETWQPDPAVADTSTTPIFYFRGAHRRQLSTEWGDGNGNAGTSVDQGPGQQWRSQAVDVDNLLFHSVLTNRRLTGGPREGSPDGFVSTTNVTATWERWKLEEHATNYSGRALHFVSVHRTQLAARPDGSVYQSGNRKSWETWTIEPSVAGTCVLRSWHNTYLSSNANGEVTSSASMGPAERWHIFVSSTGRLLFESDVTKLHLGVRPDGSVYTHQNAESWEQWSIILAPPLQFGDTFLLTNHNKLLGGGDHGSVYTTTNRGDGERWSFEDAGNGAVYLRSQYGTVLTADPGRGVVHTVSRRSLRERWRIDVAANGALILRSAFYPLHLGMTPEGAVYTSISAKPWEHWRMDITHSLLGRGLIITGKSTNTQLAHDPRARSTPRSTSASGRRGSATTPAKAASISAATMAPCSASTTRVSSG